MKKTYLLVLGLLCQQSFAQTRGLYVPDGQGVTHLAQQEKRIALVIGNKSYQHWGKLMNPVNDAHLMATVLSECGFAVTELPDANKDAMINGIETFAAQISGTETVALFFYAGHGIEAFGKNYLIPTSDNSKCRDDLAVKSVDLEYIQRKLAGAAMTILVVDACRDNQLPFTCVVPNRPINKQGFAETKPDGIFIGFSTAPGTTALDGIGQKNSPYTAALAEVIRKSAGEEIESVFKTVRSRVRLKGQLTWHHSGYDGKFFFKPAVAESERDKDSDGDGIADSVDKCPYEKGTREYNGCPPPKPMDSDGDGIPDIRDKCPNQFGEPEDGGCPNYTENELIAIAKIEEAKRTGADSLSLQKLDLKRLPSAVKHLTGLKKVDLSENEISNIAVLKELKQLNALYWSENKISDISILRELKQLKTLDLSYNQLSDVSALQESTQLTTLNLSVNLLSDVSALRELKQLKELDLGANRINNVFALQELKQLTTLNLSGNQLSDVSVLRALKQLKELYLWENQLSDISVLRELKQLTTLDLSKNQLGDVSVLRALKQLKELYLRKNQLSDISVLRELKQLTILDLYDNQISDASGLRELKLLTWLSLVNNKIQYFNLDLNQFPNLNTLRLSGNPIQNIPKEIIGIDDCASELRAYQKQQRK